MDTDNQSTVGYFTRLFVPGLAVLACVVIISLGVLSHTRFTSNSVELFQQNQLSIAASAAQGVDSLIHNLESQLDILSRSGAVQKPHSVECRTAIKQFYYSNKQYVYAGYRMDLSKRLVQMYPTNPQALGADISAQDHVKELFRTGNKVVSGRFHAVEGFDAITIHYPVYRNRQLDGSVATLVRLSSIGDTFINPIRTQSSGGYGWMVDDTGVIVSHPDAALIGKRVDRIAFLGGDNPAAAARRLARNLQSGRKGAGHYGGMLLAYVPVQLGAKHWSVIVATPYAAIGAPIKRNLTSTLSLMALVLLLLAGAAYWLMQSNVRAAGLEHTRRHLEEKLALQDQLRQNRDHLETIIRTMPSGLFTIDNNQIILTWNETAEEITGYKAEDVIGRACSIFHMEPCNTFCGLWNHSISKPIIGAECRFRRKDGREIVISKNVDYMHDAQGHVTGGIESFIDVTQARRAEEARINAVALEKEVKQLRRMDEIKTNFLSMVSHELRTPLSVILGNLTLALRGRFGALDEGLHTRLETIQKRARQLNHLIENLLNLTRLETGKLDINKEPLDAAQLLDETLLSLKSEIDDNRITIEQRLEPGHPAVFADRNMVMQVLTNVLGNAVKFTPENGTITISTRPLAGALEFTVADTGVGIPEDALPRVFDRFFQADNSPTRSFGGTGLGLSIVKEIIDMHKGSIQIHSRECEGTRVVFTLPRPDDVQTADLVNAAPDPEPEPELPSGPPRKILIVDDDVDFLNMICDMFYKSRFHIISAPSTVQGLEMLRDEKPDLILLDLMMAGKDGFFFLKIAQADETTRATPVIVLSASVDEKHQKKSADLGAAAYITKPVDQDTLLRTIQTLMA